MYYFDNFKQILTLAQYCAQTLVNQNRFNMINTDDFQVDFKHKIYNGENTSMNGHTQCMIIINEEKPEVYQGESLCSKEDNFSRKLGRKYSFERAVENIQDKDLRMNIRKAFNEHEGYPFTDKRE